MCDSRQQARIKLAHNYNQQFKKNLSAAVTHRFCLNTVAKPTLMIRHSSQQKLLAVAQNGRSSWKQFEGLLASL